MHIYIVFLHFAGKKLPKVASGKEGRIHAATPGTSTLTSSVPCLAQRLVRPVFLHLARDASEPAGPVILARHVLAAHFARAPAQGELARLAPREKAPSPGSAPPLRLRSKRSRSAQPQLCHACCARPRQRRAPLASVRRFPLKEVRLSAPGSAALAAPAPRALASPPLLAPPPPPLPHSSPGAQV